MTYIVVTDNLIEGEIVSSNMKNCTKDIMNQQPEANEIEEIMGLSDRIYVMANGQLSEPLSSAQVTASKLGELMLSRTDSDISEKSETMQSQ